ncbi:hypothetical protein [Vibrio parahaemolyticus]|uniref:hypothetical protein n=1 Tax=Vibrio parahaemolyticus TaxID=670 RepID=UPI0007DC0E63|nr:hypothetical protein [Vibrio parahaemolyticus]EIU7615485.1 hypothetical protein [Vibrio vulnificus]AVW95434.1 hypothetical protein DA442_09950 [Vibrio parahaemolyticus]EGQ8739873.1 hypothetical protein [Vibrio parahaemolyticus]EGQ8907616.1 hypothetical protein [Vibrio parahaemolyticus]EGR3101543.1 hypothetical protein [Vibrio parahaemolyticus]
MSSSSVYSALIPIVGVIIGSGLTGVITYFNNHKQRKYSELIEQKKLDIARIEECYELLDSLNEYTCKLIISMADSVRDSKPMSADGIERVSTDRLELLSNLYFEGLKTESKIIKDDFSKLTQVIATYCVNEEWNGNKAKQYLKAGHDVSNEIMASIDKMKEALICLSKTLNTVA